MNGQTTFHIHLRGRVQGVGFRPFVCRLAASFGLTGSVRNGADGVHVVFNARPEEAQAFFQQTVSDAPAQSIVNGADLWETNPQHFSNFSIAPSDQAPASGLLLTPDFALCNACKMELLAPLNRRYRYAFITCTQCGPRYSILTGLPYDREQTAMVDFDMCETCLQEYNDPADKRFLSQTNSCPKCGVNLLFSTATDLTEVLPGDPLENAVEKLKNGDIVAVKGVGGYLLLCDATNAATVEMLRKRKQRPTKPFAVLYPDVDVLAGDAMFQ
ncbi:MAG: carbamoyltransferase HypF, partial [Saprospiraceae bacterium]|nr:carbamoyltransferase HypF [Saprospiraceae bacterium]